MMDVVDHPLEPSAGRPRREQRERSSSAQSRAHLHCCLSLLSMGREDLRLPPTTCFSTAREGGRSPAQIIPLITVSTTASLEYQAGSPLSRPLADQPRIVPARSGAKISPAAATTPIRSSMLVLRAGLLSERRPCAAPRSSRSSAQASGRERPDWLLLEICPPTTEAGDIRTMRSSRSRQASKPPTGAKIYRR